MGRVLGLQKQPQSILWGRRFQARPGLCSVPGQLLSVCRLLPWGPERQLGGPRPGSRPYPGPIEAGSHGPLP